MKRDLQALKLLLGIFILSILTLTVQAQATLEWRLVNLGFSTVDPDGGGPARGVDSFKLQVHAVSGSATNVNVIATGYSYQSSKAMIPTGSAGPGCPLPDEPAVNEPSNIKISAAFTAAGFKYNAVKQCSTTSPAQMAGGQSFDKRAVGTLEGPSITITTDWVDVFTVTLWSTNTAPDAGFAIINSGSGGAPGEFTTYSVSDADANEYPVNSLTYSTPVILPVSLNAFDITCTNNGAMLNWQTLSEDNNSHFEIERSENGSTGWTSVGVSNAIIGNGTRKSYEFVDLSFSRSFYRLKQVDRDGRFSYSSVKQSNCQVKQTNLVVYPVPARDILNIVVGVEKNSKASLVLVDLSGKTIRQLNTSLIKGTNNIRMNVSGLPAGQYMLRIVGSEITKTHKVIIAK